MAELTKQALQVENNTNFPNNTTGYITPELLREFNTDMIDSTVNQSIYNANSSSWNVSIGALNNFTASQQPSFTNLNAFTASQLIVNSNLNLFTQSAAASITNLNAYTASHTGAVQVYDEGVLVSNNISAFNFTGNGITASYVSGKAVVSVDFSSLNSFTQSQNVVNTQLNSFTSSQQVQNTTLGIVTASLNNATASLYQHSASVNAFTQSVTGSINALNALTSSINTSVTNLNLATQSLQSQLTTIGGQSGSWGAGGSSQVTSASFNQFSASVNATTASLNSATASLFTSASLSLTTASIAGQILQFRKGDATTFNLTIPTGSQSIVTGSYAQFYDLTTQSGSANTPYALKFPQIAVPDGVILSGSTGMQVGAPGIYNIQFSLQAVQGAGAANLNVWFKKNGSNISNSDTQWTVPSQNKVVPVVNILDQAALNDVYEIWWQSDSANTTFSASAATGNTPAIPSVITTIYRVDVGGGFNSATFATTGSNTFSGNQTINGTISASAATIDSSITMGQTGYIRFLTGSSYFNQQLVPGAGDWAFSRDGVSNTKVLVLAGSAGATTNFQNNPVSFIGTVSSVTFNQPIVVNNGINSNLEITGGLNVSNFALSNVASSASVATHTTSITNLNIATASLNSYTASNDTKWNTIGALTGSYATTGSNTFNGGQIINGQVSISSSAAFDLDITGSMKLGGTGTNTIQITGSTASIFSTLSQTQWAITSASLSAGITSKLVGVSDSTAGAAATKYIAISANPAQTGIPSLASISEPSILAASGSNTYYAPITFQRAGTFTDGRVTFNNPISASAGFTGSLTLTGSAYGNVVSMSIASNTASMDLSTGNYFELTSSVTPLRIEFSNVKPGVSSTLIISASASSSIILGSAAAQPSGSAYSGSAGSIDILSFVAFNTSKINVVATKALI